MSEETRETAIIAPETREAEVKKIAKPESSAVGGLHTLKGDISTYIKEKDISLTEIAAEMTKRRRLEKENAEPKKIFLLAGGTLLIIAGLATASWLIFFREKTPSLKDEDFKSVKSLVPRDRKEDIVLKSENRSELINLIRQTAELAIPLNSVLYAPIFSQTQKGKEFISAPKFFKILQIIPPHNFVQSLEGNFTLGIYYLKKNSPFLIFEIRSFDLALSGILAWEKNIGRDLKKILLFGNISSPEKKFEDRLFKNRDVRILYDAENNPLIIHAFFDKQYLIIASDLGAIDEIFERLISFSPR